MLSAVSEGDIATSTERVAHGLQVDEGAGDDLLVVSRIEDHPAVAADDDKSTVMFEGRMGKRPTPILLSEALDDPPDLLDGLALVDEVVDEDSLACVRVGVDPGTGGNRRHDAVSRPRADPPGRNAR